MRFMTIVRSREGGFGPPPPALFQAIGELGMEAAQKGIKVEQGGLMHSSSGATVRLSPDGTLTVKDGPFSEAKEVFGVFAIYTLGSKAEAIDWAKKFLELHKKHWKGWEGEVEIRQMMEFGPPA